MPLSPTIYILTITLTLVLNASTWAQEKIVLGQSAAFTGSSRSLGIELWRGAQVYFNEVNLSQSLAPYKIEVEALDDSYEGDRALLNTITLVKEKQVFGLFGYVGTPTIVRALPAVQKLHFDEGIFLFSNFTGAGPQRHYPYQDFVFNVRASYEEETQGLVDQLVANGHHRIGVFIQNDAYGRSGAHGVAKALAKHHLKIIFETSYQRGTKYTESMIKQVNDLKNANVDAIIAISSYEASAAFIRDARLNKLNSPIANVSFVGPDQLLDILKTLESQYQVNLTDKLINSQVVPPWNDTSIPIVAEYQKLMKKYSPILPPQELMGALPYTGTGSELGFTSLEGFINAKLFVTLLKEYLSTLGDKKLGRRAFAQFIKNHKPLDIGLGYPLGPVSEDNQFSHQIYFTEIGSKDKDYRLIKSWDSYKKSEALQ